MWRFGQVVAAACLALTCAVAHASFETWVVDEIYSNGDGTVQYVVLHESQGLNQQDVLLGQRLTVTRAGIARSFVLDHNLPSMLTAGKRLLVASSGFAALGIITPDYVMPNRFLPIDGATLDYAGVDQVVYPPLPIDGANAFYRGGTIKANVATNFLGATTSAPDTAITAVEFYNPALDHYFASALAPDIDALDSGRIPGWYRTGQTFRVYATLAAAGAGGSPVCRFYIPPQHGDSHFLSASPAECSTIAQKIGTDPNYSGYILESSSVFFVALPDTTTGACPAGTIALYRLWNQRADSNHRYTTDPAIEAQMIAMGYVAEGYGPDAVAMCVPANATATIARVSDVSPLPAGCERETATGALYVNAEVEPRVEVDPGDPMHLIGVWQQDRWSDGGARGLLTGVSHDGGHTWTKSSAAFSRCTGGVPSNGTDFARASDPWITISPNGIAYQIAIAFSGPTFGASSSDAVLVSRSTDGGATWGVPTTLIRDTRTQFNDKESITADPIDSRYVYAVWDRIAQTGGGPSWFARTSDGGLTWEPAHVIYDPGARSQTLNNQIVVLPDGNVIDFFTRFDSDANNTMTQTLAIIRSGDHGATWSAPIPIAQSLAVGAKDPQTGAPIRDAADIGSISVGRNGRIAAVWQDSRFSAGARDAIAFAQSVDGGLTWSTPVRINAAPNVQAFLPTVKIRDDGTIGVTYYDFRNDTPDPVSLPTDVWLTQSADGATWREVHVAGPFNLARAPFAEGYFLGDYQGLTSAGDAFLPFFAQTTADPNNLTDIYSGLAGLAAMAAKAKAAESITVTAGRATPYTLDATARQAIERAAKTTLERRRRCAPSEQASPPSP